MIEPAVSRAAWAVRITAAWRKSVEGVIEAGRLLSQAKAALPHGAFSEMIQRDLPFKASTAQRLMKIAADERLTDAAHVQLLPPHWGTLYELTKLSDDAFKAKIASGAIHPELERRDVVMAAARERRIEREAELGARQYALPDKHYGVIYADPPWPFDGYSDETGLDRVAESHYPTMTVEEIKALDVPSIAASDCVLWLWTTGAVNDQAFEVIEAWGFEYKTQFVWVKDRIVMGYWTRSRHELLLIGTRGSIPAPTLGTQWESVIEAPVREHSRKPDEAYALIEAYFPSLPKVELFARAARKGWDRWGAEAPASEAAE
jgi:N6-adenosine-specific RNA methylase IME4